MNSEKTEDKENRFPPNDGEASRRYKQWKSKDPFPSIHPALLNSADIEDYVAVTGMLYPFNRDKLKSASYEVPLEGEIHYWDEKGEKYVFTRKDKEFILRENSIAFVYLETKFRIPDYIALRFNLKIKLVHRGLLLGTGPLIDPGFEGNLLIPLHNLTTNNYTFKWGEGFIWVEFTKLTENPGWINCNPEPERFGEYKKFPQDKINKDAGYYFWKAAPGLSIRSSIPDAMQESANKAQAAESQVRSIKVRFEIVGVIGLIFSLIAIFLTLKFGLLPVLQLVNESTNYVKGAQKEYIDYQKARSEEIEKLKAEIKSLRDFQKNLPRNPTEPKIPKKTDAISK